MSISKGIFIVCSNGYGHFRRTLKIAAHLKKAVKSLRLEIFCTPKQTAAHQHWPLYMSLMNSRRVKFSAIGNNVNWSNDPGKYTAENLGGWLAHIPSKTIADADFVISDNLSSILHIRPNAVLMGSFLWPDILHTRWRNNETLRNYHREETALLHAVKPPMICLGPMVMPYIEKHTRPISTGWVIESLNDNIAPRTEITNILIAGGGTGFADENLVTAARLILKNPKYHLHVSEKLAPHLKAGRERVNTFDFDAGSFPKIDLMVCRPGIGSLTEAVKYHIPVLALNENNNPELDHNAHRIESLGIGKNLNGYISDTLEIIQQLVDDGTYRSMQNKLTEAPKNGIEETVRFIISHFSLRACLEVVLWKRK
ncbi:MAG: hypothetical protein KDD09_25060 [Phaeodactylibacter sp.]|nr:hypothetical protein [Phaeodactylibacter sp.]